MEDKTVIALKYKVINSPEVTMYTNQEDKLHCEEGPAIVWASGREAWFLNGKRHRADGPAIYDKNDPDQSEWWHDGVRIYPDIDSK